MNDSDRITRDGADGRIGLRSILEHPLVVGVVTTMAAVLIPKVFARGTSPSSIAGVAGVAVLLSGLGLLVWGRRNPTKAGLFVMAMILVTAGGVASGAVAQTWAWKPSRVDTLPSLAPSSASPSPASRVGLPVRRNGVHPRDCFKLPNPDDHELPETLVIVSCDDIHDIEAYFAGNFWGPGQPYPGLEQAFDQAHEWCEGEEFTKYVGISYQYSVLRDWVLIPSAKSWAEGDRRLVCFAHYSDKSMRYSVEGLAG